MAKKPEDIKEGKIERSKRVKLSAKAALQRVRVFGKRRGKFLTAIREARIEAYIPDLPQQAY